MSRRPALIIEADPQPPRASLDMGQLRLQARGLSRVMAAVYIGVSPSKFDEMVKDGRMPPAKRVDGRRVWDRRRLDEAFEALPDAAETGGGEPDTWSDL